MGVKRVADDVDLYGAATTRAAKKATQSKLKSAPSRILVCRPNSRLGNTLLLTPLVQELEALFPGAEIDIVTACPAAPEIFREFRSVRTLYLLPRLGVRRPLAVLAKYFAAQRTRYDLVIDPCPQSWSSRFWTRSMHRRADKLGFRSLWKRAGVNYSVPMENAPVHMGQYPVYLVRQIIDRSLAYRRERPAIAPLSIQLTQREKELGTEILSDLLHGREHRPIVGLFLNATGAKRLSVSFWRQLVARLQSELPEVQAVEIVAATGVRLLPEVPGYFSTSIRRMAAVINAADWFVSADGGVMHLGAATDTPTFGLFNVSDAEKFGPYGGRNNAFRVDDRHPELSIETIAHSIALELRKRKHVFAETSMPLSQGWYTNPIGQEGGRAVHR
jgi:ADP-heptose:LPS heptosyltransferase